MSQTDKHTPLSPEELLKLLSDQEPSVSPSDPELDEFERDALEGFSLHSTPEKTKALIEEMEIAITKKVDAIGEPLKRTGKYWFSAAACLLSILIISIAYYTNTQRPDSIALHQSTDPSIVPSPDASPVEVLPGSDMSSGSSDPAMELKTEPATQVAKKDNILINEQPVADRLKQDMMAEEKSRSVGAVEAPVIDGYSDKKKMVSEGASSRTLDADISFAKAEPPATAEKEVTSYNDQNKESKDQLEDVQVKAANAKFAPKIAAASQQVNGNTTAIIDTYPHYPGGDSAVKHAILDYLKKTDPTVRFRGDYHIKISVSETGVVSVLDVKQEFTDCKKCIKSLKQALKSLTGWIPGTFRGKNSVSKKDFVLRF